MGSAHFWKRIFEKMYLEKTSCVIFARDQNLISGRSPQVVNTKKTPSAVVISFQVVSRRDGCSKVHSQRIWHSLKISQTPGIGGGDENAKTVTFLKRSPSGAGSEEEERPAGDVNANRYTCSVNLPVGHPYPHIRRAITLTSNPSLCW